MSISHMAYWDLCPLMDQIAFVQRGGNWTVSITNKGYLVIRERTGITRVHMEFKTEEDGDLSCTCTVGRDNQEFMATEFLSECKRNTPIWKQMPKRMLRHRAVAQAIMMAAGTYAGNSTEEMLEVGFSGAENPPMTRAQKALKDLTEKSIVDPSTDEVMRVSDETKVISNHDADLLEDPEKWFIDEVNSLSPRLGWIFENHVTIDMGDNYNKLLLDDFAVAEISKAHWKLLSGTMEMFKSIYASLVVIHKSTGEEIEISD